MLFKSTVSPGATLLLFSPLAVKFQPLLATFATSFNCETFTASVSSVPALTPVIFLSPALMPDLVTLGPPLTVKPSLLIVVSPAFTLSTLISLANLMANLSVPSATTPMLPSESLAVSVTPPTKLTVSPNLRATLFPVSPAKVSGLNACFAVLLIASLTLLTGASFTVIGALVTVTSPAFRPFVSILVLPAVTLSTLIFFDKATLTLPSSTLVLIFLSAPTTSTVSPNGFFTELPS